MGLKAYKENNDAIIIKRPASVIPIQNVKKKKGVHHEVPFKDKSGKELPLFHNERIFKAKKHDPL
jgi:hypothetical protein